MSPRVLMYSIKVVVCILPEGCPRWRPSRSAARDRPPRPSGVGAASEIQSSLRIKIGTALVEAARARPEPAALWPG